jgi:hypothetical protein
MSGDTLGTAMDALFLVGGGLGFARLGWGGLNPRTAAIAPETAQDGAAPAAAPQPPARPSTGWQVFWILILLFGGFIALCGLLLGLSLVWPGSGA